MKNIITFLTVFIVGCFIASGQNSDTINYEQLIKKAPYVFIGRVLSIHGFRSKEDQQAYASYIIEIEKIYKADKKLELGKVELIYKIPPNWSLTNGMLLTDRNYLTENIPFQLGRGSVGIFACNQLLNLESTTKEVDNEIKLTPICGFMDCLITFRFDGKKGLKGFSKTFENLDETEDYIKSLGFEKNKPSKEKM